ncbi:MAG: sigma-54-dependent Fis family transcriptional regulator [Deltaproteobacteria bacterium]|nr:sigma-54-dependent Fis family transcriptional regulator [Deltaproteobacteria bacterium]
MNGRALVLVVDDDASLRETLSLLLSGLGHEVVTASDVASALAEAGRHDFDLVLTDLRMPRGSGLDLVAALHEASPSLPVLVLTAYGSIQTAVDAMRLGAVDYVTKPFDNADLTMRIRRALERERLRMENDYLRAATRQGVGFGAIVGHSAAIETVFGLIERVAATDSAVLVTGETGTGKEMVAREIHLRSPRSAKLLVPVHIASIPSELLESELFGHEKGAFTGATASGPGLFEVADGGTLLLDEIGEAPMHLQPKLLRVLQDGVVRRVGGTRERRVDVRLVSATNRDLKALIEEKAFRADLYYRLDVIGIRVPPLRERMEDILPLTAHFVDEFAGRLGRGPMSVSKQALRLLEAYHWPGNVRELRNAVERAVVLARGDVLETSLFDLGIVLEEKAAAASHDSEAAPDAEDAAVPLSDMVSQFERDTIFAALARAGGVKRHAAELLGLNERTFWYKLRKYGGS